MVGCSKRVQNFIDLVCNVMEAYTAALFVVDKHEKNGIKLYCCHSFSKQIDWDCRIFPGEGIVGWVYREQKSIPAHYFERSTTTLKFYKKDEEIKSLLAVPLPSKAGVLYVDTKKSYTLTEKKERILGHMALTAFSLVESVKEKEENGKLLNLLEISKNMDKIISMYGEKKEILRKGYEIIGKGLRLSTVLFVVPDHIVMCCEADAVNKKFRIREFDLSFFSYDGLLGWCIKREKKLVRERIVENKERSFILNRDESFGFFSNFVGIPMNIPNTDLKGGMGLVKKGAERWEKREIDIVSKLAQRLFLGWINGS
ncbi:MAG: GAF domain-containing protein [Thermodesulfobacteriota bacterium]|nr:GAF domain-containing protein [Thermodesulfobacteriota bacterium]